MAGGMGGVEQILEEIRSIRERLVVLEKTLLEMNVDSEFSSEQQTKMGASVFLEVLE